MMYHELEKKMNQLNRAINLSIKNAQKEAQINLLQMMLRRIHNEGQMTNGKMIGRYKWKYWKKVRLSYGNQVAYKDLQHQGNLANQFRFNINQVDQVQFGFMRNMYDQSYSRWLYPKGYKPPNGYAPIAVISPYQVAMIQERIQGGQIYNPNKEELLKYGEQLLFAVDNAIKNTFK